MNTIEIQQLLYWMANNVHIWASPTAMALAAFVIGIFHLVAIANERTS